MKKSFMISISILSLFGCTGVYYPYEGTKTIRGEGGFIEKGVIIDNIKSDSILHKAQNYKYDNVIFYISGLPLDKKCTLIGYIADKDYFSIAKKIIKLNGNTATKSSVSFPVKFDNNSGTLGAVGSTEDWYNGYGQKVAKGYNIFECK